MILQLLLSLHMLLVIACLLRILSRENLPSVTRLAWFSVIVSLPVLGVLVYLMFGEVSLGRTLDSQHQVAVDLMDEHAAVVDPAIITKTADIPPMYRSAFAYAASINGFNLVNQNHVELLPNPAADRARIIDDINAAQKSIHVLYYIWMLDETGMNMIKALKAAVKRGVNVRVMVDGMGSRIMLKSHEWQGLSDAGIKTAITFPVTNPVASLFSGRIDIRNHRKITVIDDKITYCGSQNCADPEFHTKPKYAPWIDIMTRVTGPVVAQNQNLFVKDWLMHYGPDESIFQDINLSTPKKQAGGIPAIIWGDGPTERPLATPQLFTAYINASQETLTITTPYFVPSTSVVEALCAAALRGVDVKLILPEKNDSWIVRAASRSFYKGLLEAGVKIYEYRGGLLHSKILTLDGNVAMLGSTNLDLRSFDINYENNIIYISQDLTAQIDKRQSTYLASTTEVKVSDVKSWNFLHRCWNNVIATLGPLL